ncbi:hypothetical protein BAE44_0013969 [Dichanthelium oligosanthes]|uniref:DUF1618 domain-containing protein n=1 Tax=Dichanthelium oligosanthes TaxID=888268 RepID=A0A1E5VIV0_9POAL|nr:hypothetical protein BAE44_0013969 [Dichanthelium oligosanthes]
MALTTFPVSSEGKGHHHDTPISCVLLDLQGYIANRPNATIAWSKTSTGLPISVSFCIARPPALSHFSVHCPDVDLAQLSSLPPKVISTDADLIVLRVPLDPAARTSQRHSDYFVYRMHPRFPKLDLLPNPRPALFGDGEIAVLSCAPTAERAMYHMTTKVITLGGDQGIVGWVDLWRGILLCDVLSESPTLRDIPLPLPAKGNWSRFLNYCPYFFRDINVNGCKDTRSSTSRLRSPCRDRC